MAEAHRDEIAKLEALYASNPGGRVFTHLAEAYRKAGEGQRAQEILTEGLRRHPDSASAYVVLGRVLSDNGDVPAGLDAFRKALELDAGNLVALRWCGDLALRSGQIDDALTYYHELLARDPSDAALGERIEQLEADRNAVRTATTDEAAEPESIDAPGEPSQPDESHTPDAPGDALLEIDAAIAAGDATPEDLPGDLAAFAGWNVSATSADEAEAIDPDHDIFSGEGLVDLVGTETHDLDFEALAAPPAATPPAPEEPAPEELTPAIEEFAPVEEPEPAIEEFAVAESEIADVDHGGFSDALGGPPIEPAAGDAADGEGEGSGLLTGAPVTETMAQLYLAQGFPERAVEVYRQLLQERGSDARLEQRLAEIEAETGVSNADSAAPEPEPLILDEDETGERWLREEDESPWLSGDSAGAPAETPSLWSAEPDERNDAHATQPIGSYLQNLLQWSPSKSASDAGDELLLLDETPAAEPVADTVDEPWSAAPSAPAEEPMLLSDVAYDDVPAAPSEPMPWELGATAPTVDAGAELMPWETAPAAAPVPAERADDGIGAGPSSHESDAEEDDEDLEMFRTWLQSLKK
jgi:tetratricopeptide (TPR) repeat protein